MILKKPGFPSDTSSFSAPCHQGSERRRMSGIVGLDVCPLVGRLGAVFMRNHKYACRFMLYGGIYDRGVTVFALSEVIYLSSAVTEGMNKTRDDCISCQTAPADFKCSWTLEKHIAKSLTFVELFIKAHCVIHIVSRGLLSKLVTVSVVINPCFKMIRHGQIESSLTGIKKKKTKPKEVRFLVSYNSLSPLDTVELWLGLIRWTITQCCASGLHYVATLENTRTLANNMSQTLREAPACGSVLMKE